MTKATSNKIRSANKHELRITLSGYGVQADGYIVTEAQLRKWGLHKPNEFGLYETTYNLLDELQNDNIKSYLICHGLTESPKIDLTIDSESVPISSIIDEDNLEYEDPGTTKDYLIAKEVTARSSDITVPKNSFLIINTLVYKEGELSASLFIDDKNIAIDDIRIATHTLDLEDDLHAAAYQNDLLNDSEIEFCEFHYKGKVDEFILNSDIHESNFFLIKRNSKGKWHDCEQISIIEEY